MNYYHPQWINYLGHITNYIHTISYWFFRLLNFIYTCFSSSICMIFEVLDLSTSPNGRVLHAYIIRLWSMPFTIITAIYFPKLCMLMNFRRKQKVHMHEIGYIHRFAVKLWSAITLRSVHRFEWIFFWFHVFFRDESNGKLPKAVWCIIFA